jgi:RHS repeat-associated protein
VYVKSAGAAIYWRRNQSAGSASYASEAVLWAVPVGTRLPAAPFVQTSQRFRSIVRGGDFNGDGRVDLLVLAQQGTCGATSTCATWVNRWMALASTGSALAPQYAFDGNSESLLSDFNADGLTDIGYRVEGGHWQLLLGKGSRGTAYAGFAGPLATQAPAPPAGGRTMIIDWDGDGRMDLLQPDATGEMRYCRSTGVSLEPCQPAGISTGAIPASPMTLDVNGDGHPDLAYSTADVRLHLHQAAPPDVLVAVTDGLGARSEFQYAALSDPAVHRPGRYAAFPVRDIARAGYVVSGMLRANAGDSRQQRYFYESAQLHVQGRGFLGFARRTITTDSASPVRVEDYVQNPAYVERIGAPSQVTVWQRGGGALVRMAFAWGRHAYGTGYETRAFGYPSSVTLERYELDGVRVSRTITASVVDVFGSLLQRTVTTTELAKGSNPGAQHVETTILSGVVNDTTNWCLGRPASTQVTRYHSLPGGAQVTRTVEHGWDYQKCRPTQEVVEPYSSTLRVVNAYAYDSYGNVSATHVTPVGQPVRSASRDWSESGRFPRSTTNAEGHVETVTWDGVFARPVAVTSPNGLVGTLQYDDVGRRSRQTRPDGTSTVFTYARCGADCPSLETAYVVRAEQRGVGDVQVAAAEHGFDRFGREVYRRRDQPGGGQAFSELRYDTRGLLAAESIPAPCCAAPPHWITHSYDVLGRRIATERPTSQAIATPIATRWRYDGLAVTEIDPVGRGTTRRYDALGRVLQVVDPAQADTDYEYDAFGNLVKVRDFSGAETLMTYDVRGLRRSITDPNAGRWTFDYLPLGELRTQTNARGQRTTISYDRLSRPVTRTEPEGTTTWTWGTSAASRNVGSLASVSSPGFQETYQFDALGRAASTTTAIGGTTFVTRQSYDPVSGVPDLLTYPASTGTMPLRVRHHHDRGVLVRLSDADTGVSYWQLDGVDSLGQATGETLGNGVRIASAYDAVTGRLVSRTAGPGGGSTHQNLGYAWDVTGNLTLREERNRGVVEQFAYDSRDRLDHVSRGGAVVLDLAYDETGNLTYKSDVGTYRYDTSRGQAVTAAGTNTYSYDANGAVVNASGTVISWLSYDLPGRLAHPGGNYSAFSYGPDRARYAHVARAGASLTETLYATGGLFERVSTGSGTTYRHYIVADGRRVAIQARTQGSSPETVYLLEDHLGGVDGFMASSGSLLTRASYQPYGARRSGDWLGSAPTPAEWQQIQRTTPRGYTDHEHLDNLGIVHMNGRVYDPVLGRFLSPDPVVQAPYDTQALNRYAYVRNNPLRYTDPTGFCTGGPEFATGQAQHCMEEILVEASGLSGWQFAAMAGQADLSYLLGGASDAGAPRGPTSRTGASAGNIAPPPPPVSGPVEEAITVSAPRMPLPASVTLVPALPAGWLSWPAAVSSRALLMMGAAGALTSVLALPAEVSETSDLLDDQGEPTHVYHFTNDTGKRGISDTGAVLPGASGLVYFSPVPYADAVQAQSALSLPRAPTGYFMIPRSNIPAPLPWSVVGPNFGQPGGGLEAPFRGIVPLTGSRWVPFGPHVHRNGGW